MNTFAVLAVMMFLNVLAYWKERNGILFLLAGGSTLATALWYRTVNRTDIGLAVSLILLVLALADIGYALKVMLWNQPEDSDAD